MVPMAGVEPAQLSPLPPQDSVSTNSTTSARDDCVSKLDRANTTGYNVTTPTTPQGFAGTSEGFSSVLFVPS